MTELVYGTLVNHNGHCALAVGGDKFLSIPPMDLEGIDLDRHMDGFSRWQAVPQWSTKQVAGETLSRAQDMQGQLQLITERLRQAKMDVVLFDGNQGWIIGITPQKFYYDAKLKRWLCPYEPVHKLMQRALKVRNRYI